MKRKLALALGMTTFLAAGGIVMEVAKAQAPGSAQAAGNAAAGPKRAEEQYKNIQVLKGLPADQLIPAMQFITASLGVECEFCHVQGAFEKDDKKTKQTARKMITMMFAIDKDNFDGHREVTCYSCHRGSPRPEASPLVATATPQPEVGGTAMGANGSEDAEVSGPQADQLFDKYLKAVGGAAAVDKVTSRVMKGTITFGDRNIPIDIFSKDPEKRISFTHTPDGDSVTAFDGHDGWLGIPGHAVREMHGPDIEGASMDADLHFAAHLKGMFSAVEASGTEKIGERNAYLVIG